MHLRIGTRASKLALEQTFIFISTLRSQFPYITTEIIPIKTTGDILYLEPLTEIGGKSLFIKEIEEALILNKIDVAVHSMKDIPVEILNGLSIGCVLEREDPRDVFLSVKYNSLEEMPLNSTVGTCSSRRKSIAKNINQKIIVKDLRGNVETRIAKLKNNDVDGIILALAGIKRLKIEDIIIKQVFDQKIFVPAIAQGAICIEARSSDTEILSILNTLNHTPTVVCTSIERTFLKAMNADCKMPIGAYTALLNSKIDITIFSNINENYIISHSIASSKEEAENIVCNQAYKILENI